MKIWLDTADTYGWRGAQQQVEWPAVPRVGDTVTGTIGDRWGSGVVDTVDWEIDSDRITVTLKDPTDTVETHAPMCTATTEIGERHNCSR